MQLLVRAEILLRNSLLMWSIKNYECKRIQTPNDFEVKPMSEMRNVFGGAGGGRITVERQ